jgi:hypothetical protein
MPVTVYASTDGSAPALDGSAGSLCTVLDACLVNGYGAKAAAGWAIAFTGTNKRAYRPPSGSLRGYVRVQDDAPRAAPFNNANEARINCFEAMSAIDTGTGRYPTAAATNVILQKSQGVGINAPWIVVADARTVYMFVQSGDYGNSWASFMAGEYYSLRSGGDAYNGILIGNVTETLVGNPVPSPVNENLPKFSALTAVTAGHYVPRGHSQTGPLITTNYIVGKHGHPGHSAAALAGVLQYPHPVDGGLWLAQVWVHEPLTLPYVRGRMRGFWHCLHPASTLKHGDTWSGTGALAGKNFMAIGPTPAMDGIFVMETSDTWETN